MPSVPGRGRLSTGVSTGRRGGYLRAMAERTPTEPERDDEDLRPTDDEPADFFDDPEVPDLGDVDDNLNA